MNSRITVKDVVVMILIIVSFTSTGIMIKNEDYRYAILSLTFTAFCVLLGFGVLIAEDADKILDLSNPNLRNPRKSGSNKRVKYISGIRPDMAGSKKDLKMKKDLYNEDMYSDEAYNSDCFESVGNMRVYKRGEEIEYHDSED